MNGVNDLKTASDEEMKQILEEKNHQIAAKETEIEKINLINTVSENAIKQLQSEIKDLNSHEKDIAEQLKTKDVELDQLSEKLVQVRIDLQEIQTDKERANGINDEQNTQLEQFNVLTEALKQTVAEKDALIAEMERDKAHLQSNVDACTVEKDQLAVECSKLREEVTSQSNPSEKDQLKTLSDEISTVTDEKNRLETLCKRLKAQLIDTRKILAGKTDSKNDNSTKELEAAQSTITQLKEELSAAISQREQVESSFQQNQQIIPKGSGSEELLQQQLAVLQSELETTRKKYSVEVSELKRLLETGNVAAAAGNFHGSLEEATELEYLRNILFEYMMGRQPTTLAKVVAAVVKFTPEQTRKIQEREEQRGSLLGQLGFA